MKCPKCKTDNLTPTKLEQDFPSMGCKSCQGTLISLIYYRDWAERSTLPLAIDQLELEQVEDNDSKVALTCPKCGRVMNRYRISDQHQNRLDMCFSCGEAWIDSGEWDLLKSLDLIKNLPVIFTESWQKNIKQQLSEQHRLERLEKLIGLKDAEQAKQIKQWLQDNKNKATIIQYLSSN